MITTLPDMTHSTSITDVMHIPDPKHGTVIRANLDIAHASVLRVCVAQAGPPTWCATLVPEAGPVPARLVLSKNWQIFFQRPKW